MFCKLKNFSNSSAFIINFCKMHKRSASSEIYNKRTKKCKAQPAKNLKQCSENTRPRIGLLEAPTKSESDRKTYRVIKLENELIALLISDRPPSNDTDSSDSDTEYDTDTENDVDSRGDEVGKDKFKEALKTDSGKIAAAALTIGVGSYSDPVNIQGLSHFLEHMVFMGSKAYPKENDFDSFIKKKGGSDNAHTDCETTTFHLQIKEDHFQEALHRFSQFFIDPLLKKEAMARERESVESEFRLASQNDTNRLEQLLMSLAREGHPAKIFTWGNMKTLKEQINDEFLYDQLHTFRKRHYSANRMTLAVQASLPLRVLEKYVIENFSSIPNNGLQRLDFIDFSDVNAFDTTAFRKLYWVKPVKDLFQINLSWGLPPLLRLYRSKPHIYIAWLIGHEGRGSLLSYLRNKLWAMDIKAGNNESGCQQNSLFTLFSIQLVLTREGMKNMEKVLDAVFSYLSLLRYEIPDEDIFNELKLVEDINFRFEADSHPEDNVEQLSVNMQYYPSKDYLTGISLYFDYDPGAISSILNLLEPDAVNISILDSSLDSKVYTEMEPWFNTRYMCRDIPSVWIRKWQSIETYPEFFLPEPNKFITTDFSLANLPDTVSSQPDKVFSNNVSELWYKPDPTFRLPIAYMYYYFITPSAQLSPKHSAMLDIYIDLLEYMLAERLYPANAAGLRCRIESTNEGIMMKMEGFNQKLPIMLKEVVRAMKDFATNLNDGLFEAVREQQLNSCHNFFIKPINLITDLKYCTVLHTYWSALDKHPVISEITVEDLRNFANELQSAFYIQNIVQGNMTEDIAQKALSNTMECLNVKMLPPGMKHKVRVIQLPKGERFCCMRSLNKADVNSVVTNYYQAGVANIEDGCIIELLMMLMEEPIFYNLRTKEQLGYDVYCQRHDTKGVLGFSITVQCQADKFSTGHVNDRIEAFISEFKRSLYRTCSDDYNDIKRSLIKTKQNADDDLREEVIRNWIEITSNEYLFDREPREIECIKKLTLNDIVKWFHEHTKGGENFRKISFQVIGHVESNVAVTKDVKKKMPQSVQYSLYLEEKLFSFDSTKKDKNNDIFITDLLEFKNNLFLWPIKKTTSKHKN